jgi:hypothetical protein
MKAIIFTTFIVLVTVLILPGVLSLGIRKIPGSFQPPLSDSQDVDKLLSVSQSFKAQFNNLSDFALTIRNPFLRNKKDLIFTITSDRGEERKVIINGSNIPDGGYINFNFSPFTDSQGHMYKVSFSAPDTKPDESLLLYHSNLPYEGEYQVNGEVKTGSLSFVSYYKPANLFGPVLIIYQNWLNKLFQDLGFAIFYLMSLFFLILCLIILNFKKKFI